MTISKAFKARIKRLNDKHLDNAVFTDTAITWKGVFGSITTHTVHNNYIYYLHYDEYTVFNVYFALKQDVHVARTPYLKQFIRIIK